MRKRKIGEIYNRPIIEGDINLKTSSEIHKSELSVPQSGGSGGDAPSGGGDMRYIDMRNADPSLMTAMMFVYLYAGFNSSGDFVVTTLEMQEGFEQFRISNPVAIAIQWDATYALGTQKLKFGETLSSVESLMKFLTEEEFYNPATFA